jgi:hypothetical protein
MNQQIASNSMARQLAGYRSWLLLGAAAVLGLVVTITMSRRRRRG